MQDSSQTQYQVRSAEGESGFTVCCNGAPVLDDRGEHAHLFPHDGDRPSRKAAYAQAKEIVDRLNRSVSLSKRQASIAAKSN